MQEKKYPKSDINRNSSFYFALGVVTIMLITYLGLNHKSYEKKHPNITIREIEMEHEEEIPMTEFKPITPPPPPPAAAPVIIEVVEDEEEIKETLIESTETDETEIIQEVDKVEIEEVEVEEIEEEIEVPFAIIENVPIFPGCEHKKNNLERKKCMSANINNHVNKKFNPDLAADLGLTGKFRIAVMFKIDKRGDVVEVRARAPHPALVKEAERVVNSLPKMKPGEQRGRAVTVSYALPILFEVKD